MERLNEGKSEERDQGAKDHRKQWKNNWKERCDPKESAPRRRRRRAAFGTILVLIGSWWLLRRMDLVYMPEWLFTWPMLLIGIGFVHLITHAFRGGFGYIMILIGSVFLARNYFDVPFNIELYFWPVLVILIGLIALFKPSKHRHGHGRWKKKARSRSKDYDFGDLEYHADDSDRLDSLVMFGAVHKDILSKDFKGGEVTCIMGGGELHFVQADMKSKAELDVTLIMAGISLIVPTNWNVVINTTNILGGVDDKRRKENPNGAFDNEKTLIVTGTVLMGGIEIKSY